MLKKLLKFGIIIILLGIVTSTIKVCLRTIYSQKNDYSTWDYTHQQEYFKNLDTCEEFKLDFYDWEQE